MADEVEPADGQEQEVENSEIEVQENNELTIYVTNLDATKPIEIHFEDGKGGQLLFAQPHKVAENHKVKVLGRATKRKFNWFFVTNKIPTQKELKDEHIRVCKHYSVSVDPSLKFSFKRNEIISTGDWPNMGQNRITAANPPVKTDVDEAKENIREAMTGG